MEIQQIHLNPKYKNLPCSNQRKVVMTVLEQDLAKFKNKKVLEIGVGSWPFAKDILEAQGCEWFGLDIVPSSIANCVGTIDHIPFPDSTFDLVLCNQMLEHIFEYKVPFKKAFIEIGRVLKTNSIFMANSPIHLHGHPWFLLGRIERIRKVVENYLGFCKIEGYYNKKEKKWRKIADKGLFSHFGYPEGWFDENDFTYQIFITAENFWQIAAVQQNKIDRLRPLKVMFRFAKELIK